MSSPQAELAMLPEVLVDIIRDYVAEVALCEFSNRYPDFQFDVIGPVDDRFIAELPEPIRELFSLRWIAKRENTIILHDPIYITGLIPSETGKSFQDDMKDLFNGSVYDAKKCEKCKMDMKDPHFTICDANEFIDNNEYFDDRTKIFLEYCDACTDVSILDPKIKSELKKQDPRSFCPDAEEGEVFSYYVDKTQNTTPIVLLRSIKFPVYQQSMIYYRSLNDYFFICDENPQKNLTGKPAKIKRMTFLNAIDKLFEK